MSAATRSSTTDSHSSSEWRVPFPLRVIRRVPWRISHQPSAKGSTATMSTAMPNVPDPVNGMIRTYDNQRRTFSRPYSAKTVFFYKEGDEYFTGVRLPVSKSRYRTIESLLDDLNQNIPMPFGVRRLTTPGGKHRIEDIDQLQHLGQYVASSSKMGRGVNLTAVERLRRARSEVHEKLKRDTAGGNAFWVPTSPSFKTKLRMTRTLGLAAAPHKQVFFVLNGKARFHRALLNPTRLPDMDQLLKDVSEGLQIAIYRLYSTDGNRVNDVAEIMQLNPPKVIAVPRHEKPMMREPFVLPSINAFGRSSGQTGQASLPSTHRTHASLPSSIPSISKSSSFGSTRSTESNGVEKPRSAVRRTARRIAPVGAGPRGAGPSRPTKIPTGRAIYGNGVKKGIVISGGAKKVAAVGVSAAAAAAVATKKARRQDDDDSGKAASEADSDKARREIEEDDASSDFPDADAPTTAGSQRAASSEGEGEGEEMDTVAETHSGRSVNTVRKKSQHISDDDTGVMDEHLEEHDHIRSEEDDDRRAEERHRQLTAAAAAAELLSEKNLRGENEEDEGEGSQSARSARSGKSLLSLKEQHEEKEEKKNGAEDEDGRSRKSEKENGAGEETQQEENEAGRKTSADMKKAAATTIQAAFRGFRTRKELKTVQFGSVDEVLPNGESETVDLRDDHDILTIERQPTPAALKNPADHQEDMYMTYTISVLTGNRWGADSECDLSVTLHGDEGVSQPFLLRNEDREPPIFSQNQMDAFHVESRPLGTLNHIVVSHTKNGYGAGIFIEHILVTENIVDGRQFIYFCGKWFDSAQVDGKLERNLPLSAFYYISSIPEDSYRSEGRWEFVLHNGTPKGDGGTTSNLNIIGYGTLGSSITTITTDSSLQKVPSQSLIQVDFGEIGDLLKVRFEIDGAGEQPDYYLEYVELVDLDTDERLAVRVAKWLDVTGKHKKPQPFREISVFRSGVTPAMLNTYEGKIAMGDSRLLTGTPLRAQLIGNTDSGLFPLTLNEDKGEYSFKVECVALGRISSIKVYGEFTGEGEAVMEGMAVLRDLWDRHGLAPMPIMHDMVATTAVVRESTHCPYRFVFTSSTVPADIIHGAPYCKELTLTRMDGLPTKSKKHGVTTPSIEDVWELKMNVKRSSNCPAPSVVVCTASTSYEMTPGTADCEEALLFELKGVEMARVEKVRVALGDVGADHFVRINKMRLRNTTTGDEVRYLTAETEFRTMTTVEFPSIYPDVQPLATVVYSVVLETEQSSRQFRPWLCLRGSAGDSGSRALPVNWNQQRNEISVEAVSLGELKDAVIYVETDDNEKAVMWSVTVRVMNSHSNEDEYFTKLLTITEATKKYTAQLYN